MKPKTKAQCDVVEALSDSVVRALAQIRGQTDDGAPLTSHLDKLADAVEVDGKRLVLASFYWELIAREAQRVLAQAEAKGDRSVRRAFVTMVVEEVSPYVQDKRKLGELAGGLLAQLLEDDDVERWEEALRKGRAPKGELVSKEGVAVPEQPSRDDGPTMEAVSEKASAPKKPR